MAQFVTINGEQFRITKAVLALDGDGKPYAGPYQTGTDPNIVLVNDEGFRLQQAVVAVGGDGQPLSSI